MMTSLLIGVFGSAIVAVLYGFFVAQREEQIRGYLAAKREGVARRRALRAFVGAIRGQAAVVDTIMLLALVLLVPFLVSTLFFTSARELQTTIMRLDSAKNIEESSEAALAARLVELQGEADRLSEAGRRLVVLSYGIGALALLVSCYGYYYWAPFVVRRRRFAYEVERFTLRIQGLADRSELASLALAESRVTDEASLREFIAAARAIALKHGVNQLVDRFDLWVSSESSTAAGATHEQPGT
jgi:hypothetical protein